jgi:HEAT repeat protein
LTESDVVAEQVMHALESNNVDAVVALGFVAVPWLELSLGDPNPAIRNAATRAIGRVGGEASISLLARARQDSDGKVRWMATACLGEMDDARTLPLLIDALRDDYWKSREAAAKALGPEEGSACREPVGGSNSR